MTTALATALGAVALLAPAAEANHHLMRITEIYPGTLANPDSAYVELKMFASGQNFTNGSTLRTYNATGTSLHVFTMNSNVPHGENQRTVLVADSFPPTDPPSLTADFTDTALGTNLAPGGGAACFNSPGFPSIDCASWGAFTGNASLPTNSGTPAAAIPDGSGLARDISAGCDTALDSSDDTNNSAGDFAVIGFALLDPTPNSVAPTSDLCAKPNTKLTKKPKSKTTDRTPQLKFKSLPGGASFQCKLDDDHFSGCVSPFKTRKLGFGKHTFKVRAKNGNGADPSPAKVTFKVVKK